MPNIYRTIAVRKELINYENHIISKSYSYGYGYNFDRNKSIISAIGEALERYCSSIQEEVGIFKSYSEVTKLGFKAINLNDFLQYKKGESLNYGVISNDTKIHWIKGKCLRNSTEVYIPASLIYIPYKYKNELIRDQITTGMACGETLDMAIYNGICELIERDTFGLIWLNKIKTPRIDIKSFNNSELNKIIDYIESYGINIIIRDITLDIGIPTYCIILKNKAFDNKDIPIRYIGIKSGINVIDTLYRLLGETLGGFISLADRYKDEINIPKTKSLIKNIEDHCLYYGKNNERHIMSFLEDDYTISKNIDYNLCLSENIADIQTYMKNIGINLYYVDLTSEDIKEIGLRVVKVISPDLYYLPSSDIGTKCTRIANVIKKFDIKESLNLNKNPFS